MESTGVELVWTRQSDSKEAQVYRVFHALGIMYVHDDGRGVYLVARNAETRRDHHVIVCSTSCNGPCKTWGPSTSRPLAVIIVRWLRAQYVPDEISRGAHHRRPALGESARVWGSWHACFSLAKILWAEFNQAS